MNFRNKKRLFLLAALATACVFVHSQAQACDQLVVHGLSYHTDRELIHNVNETNPGVGCRIGDYEVGVYENSYGDWSAYGVRDFMFTDHVGLFAGVATGYAADISVPSHGVTPVGGTVVHYKGLTARVTPTYNSAQQKLGATIGVSYAFSF